MNCIIFKYFFIQISSTKFDSIADERSTISRLLKYSSREIFALSQSEKKQPEKGPQFHRGLEKKRNILARILACLGIISVIQRQTATETIRVGASGRPIIKTLMDGNASRRVTRVNTPRVEIWSPMYKGAYEGVQGVSNGEKREKSTRK